METMMLEPDEIQNILDTTDYTPEIVTERGERAVHEAIDKMKDAMGEDDFRVLVVQFALNIEAELRAKYPEHPALRLLDEYRDEHATWRK